jgi:RND family efflux transporter MFP subunit
MVDPALRNAVAFLCLAGPAFAQAPPPTPVKTAAVHAESTQARLALTGELRARSRARVAAIEGGRVDSIHFDEAQPIRAGETLVTIDGRRLRNELAQAEAELAVRKAQLEIEGATEATARQDLAAYRAAEAARKGSVADMTLRRSERDAGVAAARVLVAERELARSETAIERLRLAIGDLVVTAPFDGVVLERLVEPGEWLAPGAAVAVLVSRGTLEAWVEVPESASANALRKSTDLAVRIDALDLTLKPLEVRAVPDVDPRSRRFRLIATLEPGDAELLPGMSVTVEIPTGAPQPMLRVPTDALVRDAGGDFVWLAASRPDGTTMAMPVTVRLRFKSGAYAFVDAPGLGDGARVVVEGNERLRPMTIITALDAAPGAAERR